MSIVIRASGGAKKYLKYSSYQLLEFRAEFKRISEEYEKEFNKNRIKLTEKFYLSRKKSIVNYKDLYKSFYQAKKDILLGSRELDYYKNNKEMVSLLLSNKEKFNEYFKLVAEYYTKTTGNKPYKITRDFFRNVTRSLGISKDLYSLHYSSFKHAIIEILEYKFKNSSLSLGDDEEKFTRDKFDIIKIGNTDVKKIYFVSAIIAGCDVHDNFLQSIRQFLIHRKAELVLLPMRGINFYDESFNEEALKLSDFFASEFIFNSNLRAFDMRINPQQRDPLIGFDMLGHKGYSCIFASPKQFMRVVPTQKSSKLPHLLYSTGTISKAEYRYTRVGRLAAQDHVYGGLIVEIYDNKYFDIRPIQADKDGCFYDGYRYYTPKQVKIVNQIPAFIVPDWHNGFEDPVVVENWIKICKRLNPKYIVFHDFFDGRSINHHDIGRNITKALVPDFINTLQKELDLMVLTLDKWSTMFPKSKIVIVRSNHDERLDRYLDEGRYCQEPFNHRLALELAIAKFDGHNPLEYYYRKNKKSKIDNVIWLKHDEDFTVCGFQLGIHGHLGVNGSRPSKRSLESAYGKSISGHTHTPSIFRNTIQVGCSCYLKLDYNKGPSGWLHTAAIVYDNHTFTLVNSIDGRIGSII